MYRLFRLVYRGPFWDDMERVSEMGKDDPEVIIIVPEDDEDDSWDVSSPIFAYYTMIEDIGRKYFDIFSSQCDVKNGYKQEYVNKYM